MDQNLTAQQWMEKFTEIGSFWRHSGNPKHPHALLTNGGHSDGFHNWSITAQHPRLARMVAHDIVNKAARLRDIGSQNLTCIDRVVAPGSGAITLADRLAEVIGEEFNPDCLSGFTEKAQDKLTLARFDCKGQRVLAAEDTLTTGSSIQTTINLIEQAGGVVLPFVFVVCNRSGLANIGERPIIALIDTPMSNWVYECPLCKAGSEAIRPKKENWERLTNPV